MKLTHIALLAGAVMVSSAAMAAPSNEGLIKPNAKVNHFLKQQADFGGYKVEHNKALVLASLADSSQVLAKHGNMAVVATDEFQDAIGKNTLVRNLLTGNVAPLSGNIILLLKQGVTAEQVKQSSGLDIVANYSDANVVVVKNAGSNIIETSKALQASGLVKEAKIEVLEVVYQAD